MNNHDAVNNPAHYDLFPGMQAIDVIRAALTPEEFAGYCKGNALKYRLRAGEKGDAAQDLAKANWYKDRVWTSGLGLPRARVAVPEGFIEYRSDDPLPAPWSILDTLDHNGVLATGRMIGFFPWNEVWAYQVTSLITPEQFGGDQRAAPSPMPSPESPAVPGVRMPYLPEPKVPGTPMPDPEPLITRRPLCTARNCMNAVREIGDKCDEHRP